MQSPSGRLLHDVRGTVAGLTLEAEALLDLAATHGGELEDIAANVAALVRRLQAQIESLGGDESTRG